MLMRYYLQGESIHSKESRMLQIINKGNKAEVLAKTCITTRT